MGIPFHKLKLTHAIIMISLSLDSLQAQSIYSNTSNIWCRKWPSHHSIAELSLFDRERDSGPSFWKDIAGHKFFNFISCSIFLCWMVNLKQIIELRCIMSESDSDARERERVLWYCKKNKLSRTLGRRLNVELTDWWSDEWRFSFIVEDLKCQESLNCDDTGLTRGTCCSGWGWVCRVMQLFNSTLFPHILCSNKQI